MTCLVMSKTTDSTYVEEKFFELLVTIPRRVAYIPSQSDPARSCYTKIRNHLGRLGIQEIPYCDIDQEFSPATMDHILQSDAIYLSGDSTPGFLRNLRRRGLIEPLKDYCRHGGHLIGVSAGAIIMGQDIRIQEDDPLEGEATRELKDPAGLDLYQFEFFPHFGIRESDVAFLESRSLKTKKPILACDDSSGIILQSDGSLVVGEAFLFNGGGHMRLPEGSLIMQNTDQNQ